MNPSDLVPILDTPFWLTALVVILTTLAVMWYLQEAQRSRTPIKLEYEPQLCGDITETSLAKYTGRDPFLPIYLAIRGKVYDVTKGRDFYGPGGGYHVFAGKEVSRALATMKVDTEACTSDLKDLTPQQLKTLQDWETKLAAKYSVVGQVVPPRQLTLQELAKHDGSTEGIPIYLSIRGTVFDVSKGKDFYGPDGVYPFAGRECARAFALLSTDTADCHADLSGLGAAEMDSLEEWEAKFHYKYPVVGSVVEADPQQSASVQH